MKMCEVVKLELETKVQTQAWVRYVRKSSKVMFLQCFDGTTVEDIQLVVPKEIYVELTRGDHIQVKATKVASKGTQVWELLVSEVTIVSHPQKYPIEKRDASLETLREIPQYRTKTRKFSSIMKLKSIIELSIAKFYSDKSFTKISPPLLTPSDCEGAGEVFSVGKDFFGREAYLTVSSQMYLEAMARSLSQVYCLAPAFRADPSLSSRHLAEFWMLEIEKTTDSLGDIIAEALSLIKFIGHELLRERELLDLLDKELAIRIEEKVASEFKVISYQAASELLGKEILGSVEEKELMEKLRTGVVLTHFPSHYKPFYMLREGDVTHSFDILAPGVGEIVGGSMREKDAGILRERMSSQFQESLAWYLDIREVDSISTGGFGLGFERILMYYLEIESIKDIATFPRWMGRMDM